VICSKERASVGASVQITSLRERIVRDVTEVSR